MTLGESINEVVSELSQQPALVEPEYRPTTMFDGVQGFLQTGRMPVSQRPSNFTELLEQFGYDPTEVAIAGPPAVSRWQVMTPLRDDLGRKTGDYETTWLEAYKFKLVAASASSVDLEKIVSEFRSTPPKPQGLTSPYWLVFQAGDQQLGKRSRDGSTEQIVDRYLQSVAEVKNQFRSLKHLGLEGIQISMPGDCLEGNQSQGGRNMWLTQEAITEQTRILRRLMMYTLEELAPLAPQIYLDVVNGNHDQAQRDPVSTYPGDGWATECAIAVDDALQMNQTSFGHVTVRVPEKWSGYMTVPVGDSIVTVVHGHQWSKTQGPMRWWEQQAINNQPPGAAQLLQHGHWHEYQLKSNQHRMALGSPTFDCGSDWYREKTGATSRRGGLVYLLKSGEVSRLSVV